MILQRGGNGGFCVQVEVKGQREINKQKQKRTGMKDKIKRVEGRETDAIIGQTGQQVKIERYIKRYRYETLALLYLDFAERLQMEKKKKKTATDERKQQQQPKKVTMKRQLRYYTKRGIDLRLKIRS